MTTRVNNRMIEGASINPLDFNVAGDGVTDDTIAIQNMLASLKADDVIDWGNRVYHLGTRTSVSLDGSNPIFKIDSINGLSFINNPTFTINQNIPNETFLMWDDIFQFVDCSDLYFEGKLVGDAYDIEYPNGMCLVSLISDSIDATNVTLNVQGSNCLSPFMTNRTGNTFYRKIHAKVNARNVTYGTRLVDNGTNVHVDINAEEHARSFFCTGVVDIFANVNSRNQRKIDDILIKSYNRSVDNIIVNLNQFNSTGTEWPVAIEFENDSEATYIKNVQLNINSNKTPTVGFEELVMFTQRNSSGVPQASSNSVIDNITINGLYTTTDQYNPPFGSRTYWNNGGRLHTVLEDAKIQSFGFTLLRGGEYKAKFRGAYGTNNLFVTFANTVYPAVNFFKVKVFGTDNYGSLGVNNGFYLEQICQIPLTASGNGTVTVKETIADIPAGAPSTPTISYTMNNGKFEINTSDDTDYQGGAAELSVSVELLSTL